MKKLPIYLQIFINSHYIPSQASCSSSSNSSSHLIAATLMAATRRSSSRCHTRLRNSCWLCSRESCGAWGSTWSMLPWGKPSPHGAVLVQKAFPLHMDAVLLFHSQMPIPMDCGWGCSILDSYPLALASLFSASPSCPARGGRPTR